MKKKALKVTGTVVSGVGESGTFLAIPWVNKQIAEKLHFSPYCGTLNIDVRDPGVQKEIKKRCGERILPEEEGFCDALVCGGMIAGKYPCGIILPLVPNYPDNVLEIVAAVHLKKALRIEDGDGVEMEIYPEQT
jgi:riboflavin kinase